MWNRAFAPVGWWFVSSLFASALAAVAAQASQTSKVIVPAIVALMVLWTVGCAVAVIATYLKLTGCFFRRTAARLYRDMAPFFRDAADAQSRLALHPDEPIRWDVEAMRHRYFRCFYRRLDRLARETEERREVYPPPPDLLHPLSFESMERSREWVRSLTRCRAWSR
jgi:hypothetical protein